MFANVFLNDEFYGLYTMNEFIDPSMMYRHGIWEEPTQYDFGPDAENDVEGDGIEEGSHDNETRSRARPRPQSPAVVAPRNDGDRRPQPAQTFFLYQTLLRARKSSWTSSFILHSLHEMVDIPSLFAFMLVSHYTVNIDARMNYFLGWNGKRGFDQRFPPYVVVMYDGDSSFGRSGMGLPVEPGVA